MDQKDTAEVVIALRETLKKLDAYEFTSAMLNEAIEDIEGIIDFLENHIED